MDTFSNPPFTLNMDSLPPDLLSMLNLGQMDPRLNDFLDTLTSLSEKDLTTIGIKDDVCPICFVPFLAILAEEEMALAMDSPTYSTSELGVTRLSKTCRHTFCRKDITKWVHEGRDSCPTCRTPFLPASTPNPSASSAPSTSPPSNTNTPSPPVANPAANFARPSADTSDPPAMTDEQLQQLLPGLSPQERQSLLAQMDPVMSMFSQPRRTPNRRDHDDDRNEYAGMYS